jgi:hypothetical protein
MQCKFREEDVEAAVADLGNAIYIERGGMPPPRLAPDIALAAIDGASFGVVQLCLRGPDDSAFSLEHTNTMPEENAAVYAKWARMVIHNMRRPRGWPVCDCAKPGYMRFWQNDPELQSIATATQQILLRALRYAEAYAGVSASAREAVPRNGDGGHSVWDTIRRCRKRMKLNG